MPRTESIHIGPLYRDVTPLITPVLNQSFLPSAGYILTSPHIAEQAANLNRTLRSLGIQVSVHHLDDK